MGRENDELTDLLTKLYTIQEDIGAKPKTTEDEKRNKAANISKMGTGKKAEKKGSKFLELKSTILPKFVSKSVSLPMNGGNWKAFTKMRLARKRVNSPQKNSKSNPSW